ncbi:hypothetical protein EOD39_14844 [Acipenser ruthenus]|uniref:Uncharacterized protein n=1 Tax=Acipenser ruthenus TaxID=7906 RepID=A0A662YNH4_ACIRT|nr:hypothetical protein EOD39_14844 [Acipenser ruthenus]
MLGSLSGALVVWGSHSRALVTVGSLSGALAAEGSLSGALAAQGTLSMVAQDNLFLALGVQDTLSQKAVVERNSLAATAAQGSLSQAVALGTLAMLGYLWGSDAGSIGRSLLGSTGYSPSGSAGLSGRGCGLSSSDSTTTWMTSSHSLSEHRGFYWRHTPSCALTHSSGPGKKELPNLRVYLPACVFGLHFVIYVFLN